MTEDKDWNLKGKKYGFHQMHDWMCDDREDCTKRLYQKERRLEG